MAKGYIPKSKNTGAKDKYITLKIADRLPEIEGWARDGLIDKEIAARIGVSQQTLWNWRNKYPELGEALKRGKEVIDAEVENSLLKRALGYTYDEVTEIESEQGFTRKVIRKHVAPDTTAQIFWLKNRKPAQWRDKQEIKHEGEMNITFVDDLDE
jgi:transposase-like protein